MIMCFSATKKSKEQETIQENLGKLLICIEKGEKKLCKIFKKTNQDGNVNKTTKQTSN